MDRQGHRRRRQRVRPGAFEFLSTKVGLVVVILGFMHFTNVRLLVK